MCTHFSSSDKIRLQLQDTFGMMARLCFADLKIHLAHLFSGPHREHGAKASGAVQLEHNASSPQGSSDPSEKPETGPACPHCCGGPVLFNGHHVYCQNKRRFLKNISNPPSLCESCVSVFLNSCVTQTVHHMIPTFRV